MDIFELYNIAERNIELINPFSADKIETVGRFLGMKEGQRVLDFGSGYAEPLIIWAETFGINGIGVDIRPHVCSRAERKIAERGLQDRLSILCMDGSRYEYEKHAFDVAACIGASFIWGDFRKSIRGMKDTIHDNGKLVVGEPYWLKTPIPEEYQEKYPMFLTEYEIAQTAREEGYDIMYMVRASDDDWARYEAGNWYGLCQWIEENADHPERQQVIDWLHENQDEHFRFGREFCGWAVYILTPKKY